MSADLAKLGDALDAAESTWDAAHPNFAGQALLWSVKVDKAYARYRKAVRAEVTRRHRRPSEYTAYIAGMTFPADATSLRQMADAEAQRILSGHSLKLHFDFQNRARELREQRRKIRRAVARRRSLGFAC